MFSNSFASIRLLDGWMPPSVSVILRRPFPSSWLYECFRLPQQDTHDVRSHRKTYKPLVLGHWVLQSSTTILFTRLRTHLTNVGPSDKYISFKSYWWALRTMTRCNSPSSLSSPLAQALSTPTLCMLGRLYNVSQAPWPLAHRLSISIAAPPLEKPVLWTRQLLFLLASLPLSTLG